MKLSRYNSFMNKMHRDEIRARLTLWDTDSGRKELLRAFSTAQEKGFMKGFLDDLLLESEIKQLAARMEALDMLFMGAPYRQISDTLGLSSKTIARIAKKSAGKDAWSHKVMRAKYPRGFRYFD